MADIKQAAVNERAKEFIKKTRESGDGALVDAIYRAVKEEYVKDDVLEYIADNVGCSPVNKILDAGWRPDDIAESVAERWVYLGDYDCNLDYWANIESLIAQIQV